MLAKMQMVKCFHYYVLTHTIYHCISDFKHIKQPTDKYEEYGQIKVRTNIATSVVCFISQYNQIPHSLKCLSFLSNWSTGKS